MKNIFENKMWKVTFFNFDTKILWRWKNMYTIYLACCFLSCIDTILCNYKVLPICTCWLLSKISNGTWLDCAYIRTMAIVYLRYNVMTLCWRQDPERRPSFSDLSYSFRDLLKPSKPPVIKTNSSQETVVWSAHFPFSSSLSLSLSLDSCIFHQQLSFKELPLSSPTYLYTYLHTISSRQKCFVSFSNHGCHAYTVT